jgi:DnaJ-domain-containing protein 1
MRWLLIMLALGAAGTAGYFGAFVNNSFSSYSNEQLDMLEREMAAEREQARTGSDQQLWVQDRQQLISEERRRRLYFILALGVAGLSGVGAFLVRGGASVPRLRASADEESRLVAAVGDPAVLREGARQKAAALLGVAPDAPAAVIEAALQAQLQQRDPDKLSGLAPELKQLALAQREELTRARDLLLNKPGG